MPRPKKSDARRSRPNVYAQAVNAAKERLQKALEKKERYRMQLLKLEEEIPRLQRIIEAFEGPTLPRQKFPLVEDVDVVLSEDQPSNVRPGIEPSSEPGNGDNPLAAVMSKVPDKLKPMMEKHLKRFVEPQGPVNIEDPDRFLPDVE